MSRKIIHLVLALMSISLLSACDHSIDDKLAAQAAAEKTLGISPTLFATKFNRTIRDVLEDKKNEDAAHMAPLYAIDTTELFKGKDKHIFQTRVGPSQTAILGSFAKNGDLKSVGVLLTTPTEGARAEFLLCAETAARILTGGHKQKLPDLLKRLVSNAINNPGQHMSEIIDEVVLSAEILPQGLMFQIERTQ